MESLILQALRGPLFIFLLSFFGAGPLWAASYGGYVSDVVAEKDQRFYEIFLFSTPPAPRTALRDLIFNEQLSKEFKDKYREKFGQLDTDSIVYQPTKFSVLDENRGAVFQIEANQEKRKAFAEYMTRRLMEWHIDNYFKTDPSVRVVYELKEKLSNVNVEVTPETKVNLRYNFSDNTADVVVENPYCDSRLTLQMDPKAFGPSAIQEEKLIVEKQLTKKLRLNTVALQNEGRAQAELVRSLKSNWSMSFLTSAAFNNSTISSRETRYLIGLGHSY